MVIEELLKARVWKLVIILNMERESNKNSGLKYDHSHFSMNLIAVKQTNAGISEPDG